LDLVLPLTAQKVCKPPTGLLDNQRLPTCQPCAHHEEKHDGNGRCDQKERLQHEGSAQRLS
jgi:hypothetical protein